MNDTLPDEPSHGPPARRSDFSETSLPEPPSPELLGALDIVEAFTALRQELKLQVRSGRELQQTLSQSLERLEENLRAQPLTAEGGQDSMDEFRSLADAVAEMEESLRRAVEMLRQPSARQEAHAAALREFDEVVASSSRLARMGAGGLLGKLRTLLENSLTIEEEQDQSLVDITRQGLELLLARVHRLMGTCELQRVDVHGKPFDAELMQAVDVVEHSEVPSTHVAEQLSPAYRWQGRILRCAHVRVAK